MTKSRVLILKITLFAMFLALGWLLPFLTGQIPQIGNMLLPMHIPVILGGFILGPIFGLILGLVTPLTRTLFFGMPILYPTSLSMAIELATYGFFSGLFFMLFFKKFKMNFILSIYISLIFAMILGRVTWGLSRFIMGLASNNAFTFNAFIAGAFMSAYPGIIIQLIIIPIIMLILYKAHILDKYLVIKEESEVTNDVSNN